MGWHGFAAFLAGVLCASWVEAGRPSHKHVQDAHHDPSVDLQEQVHVLVGGRMVRDRHRGGAAVQDDLVGGIEVEQAALQDAPPGGDGSRSHSQRQHTLSASDEQTLAPGSSSALVAVSAHSRRKSSSPVKGGPEGAGNQQGESNAVKGVGTGAASLEAGQAGDAAEKKTKAEIAKLERPLQCGQARFAPMSECPEECPFFAEEEKKFCHFECVPAQQCGKGDFVKDATIPDEETHQCRRCEVEGCKTCVATPPGSPDPQKCMECMLGYYLIENDTLCFAMSNYFFAGLVVVGVIVTVLFIIWYIDLYNRPMVNPEGVAEALAHRSRTKVRMNDVPGRPVYPIDTNLCFENLGGPGTLVFFRFQAAILIFATIMFLLQVVFGLSVSTDIWFLGLLPGKTPQQMCAAIQWGRRRQVALLWVKVAWIAIGYSFAFLGAIFYAINSRRLFKEIDAQLVSMSDFCAILSGFPKKKGTEKYEEQLKKAVEDATGQAVVGVSLCWDFHDHHLHHHVLEAVELDISHSSGMGHGHAHGLSHASAAHGTEAPHTSPTDAQEAAAGSPDVGTRGIIGSLCDKVSFRVLEAWKVNPDLEEESHLDGHHVVQMLEEMESSQTAMVVFNTEHARSEALAKQSVVVEDAVCKLERQANEPESLLWEYFGAPPGYLTLNMITGSFKMALAVAAWTFILYLPYAFYMNSFSYANGDEPGLMSEGLFVGLVVLSQIGLFVVANHITHHAGFRYEDNKQCAYIVLYNAALIVNVVLDMLLTSGLSYRQMVGQGIHTADGRKLGDLKTLDEILESYPMQKAIGNALSKYCFPATFLVPFLADPFCMLMLPYFVGRFLIGSNKKMRGRKAEKAMQLPVMEQGRFADCIFNSILIALVPFIAPGYILKIFGQFILSHVFIYCYDHWRTLRACTRYHFSSDVCNGQGQKLWSIPCGILLSALVFKVNQNTATKGLGTGVLQGSMLWTCVAAAFFGHVIVHLFVLEFVVPCFDPPDPEHDEDRPYEQCAEKNPASWFSTNPVWCLRSRHIYKHEPHQAFYAIGREHLMKRNPKIGSYFQQDAAEVEDFEGSYLT